MISLILKRMQNMLKGPERNFTVLSTETGDEYEGRYISTTPSWGGGMAHSYMVSTRLRPVTVTLEVGGVHYKIKGDETVERIFEQSAYRLFPEEVNALQQLVGQSITIRARSPYNSETLKKLAKVYQPRGESV